jgi:hypothetical protein
MVTDKDSGDIPSSSTEILSNLRQPNDPMINKSTISKDEFLNLPKRNSQNFDLTFYV